MFLFCHVFGFWCSKAKYLTLCFLWFPFSKVVDPVLVWTEEMGGIKKKKQDYIVRVQKILAGSKILCYQIPKFIHSDIYPSSGNQPGLGKVPFTLISFSQISAPLSSPRLRKFIQFGQLQVFVVSKSTVNDANFSVWQRTQFLSKNLYSFLLSTSKCLF